MPAAVVASYLLRLQDFVYADRVVVPTACGCFAGGCCRQLCSHELLMFIIDLMIRT
jgi:hypothetical protein